MATASRSCWCSEVELVDFVEVPALDDTSRGAGGYGSSGGHASLGEKGV